jgi:propanediol dehydratase large subunit
MTQQATQPVTKTFTHVHDLEEAKMRAETAFAFYREKDAEAGAGVNPTFAWRGNGSVADVSFTVNKTRLTGTVLITASSMPGISKDGTVELAVNVPADLRLFAPMMVNVVAKEVEGWLTMKDL